MYPHIFKQTPSQTRLLLVLDFKDDSLNMAILEPKFDQTIKIVKDFKATKVKLKLYHINVVDKIDLHRKTREMIFKDLLHTTTSMIRFQEMFGKVEKQLNQEKTTSKIKQ